MIDFEPTTTAKPQTIPVEHTTKDGVLFVGIGAVATLTGVNYSNFCKKLKDADSTVVEGRKYVAAQAVVEAFNDMPRFGASVNKAAVSELLASLATFKNIDFTIRPLDPEADQPNPLPALGSAGTPTSPLLKPTPTIRPLNGHAPTTKPVIEPQTAPIVERMGDGVTYFLKSLIFMYVMYAVAIGIEAYLQADLFGLLIQPDNLVHNIIEPRTVTWLFLPMTLILQMMFAVLDVNQLSGKETVKLLGMEVKTMNLALGFVFIFNLSTSEYRIFHGITMDFKNHFGEYIIRALFGAVFPVMLLVLGFLLSKRTAKK